MKLVKQNFFIVTAISFAAGIALGSFYSVPAIWLGSAVSFLICLMGLLRKKTTGFLIVFVLLVMAVGMYRIGSVDKLNEFTFFIDRSVTLEGSVVSDLDVRQDKQLFYFRPDEFTQNILVTTTLFSDAAYGDRLRVTDKIELPKNFEEFNYIKFLEKDNVYALMRYPKSMLVLDRGQGNMFVQWSLSAKQYAVRTIKKRLPSTEAQLLLGILIGLKRGLPDEVTDGFSKTGLSHIVAVSGYNISVIIVAIAGLAKYIGRRWSFWLSIVIISSYVVMTGSSSSVMRAAIMGMLLLISFSAGRLYRVLPALAFSALVMLLLNPKILIWDVGFQLSFLATLGIVLLVPMLEDASRSLPAPTWLKSTLFATFAAIIATAPLIAFQFGRLSLIAPIANILVLPVIPIIMLFGFLTLLPFFGSGFGLLSKWLLEYVLFAVHYLSNVIYASIELHLDARSMLVCYVILGLAYALAYSYQKKAMSHD